MMGELGINQKEHWAIQCEIRAIVRFLKSKGLRIITISNILGGGHYFEMRDIDRGVRMVYYDTPAKDKVLLEKLKTSFDLCFI